MVRRARVKVKTGRKWKVKATIQDAENRLRIGDIVGTVAIGRGLGTTSTPRWSKADNTERREMVQREVRSMEEEDRIVKAVGMKVQGRWTTWVAARQKKLSWRDTGI